MHSDGQLAEHNKQTQCCAILALEGAVVRAIAEWIGPAVRGPGSNRKKAYLAGAVAKYVNAPSHVCGMK